MPEITLTHAPSPHAVATDPVTGQEYVLGYPQHTDDPEAIGRLRSLERLGFYFETSKPIPTEQAVSTSADEAPAQ